MCTSWNDDLSRTSTLHMYLLLDVITYLPPSRAHDHVVAFQ